MGAVGVYKRSIFLNSIYMVKQVGSKGKVLLRLIVGTAISIISVVTDRVLPQGLDDFIFSFFN